MRVVRGEKMKAGRNINWKKMVYAAALMLLLTASSCGIRADNPGSVSDEEDSRLREGQEVPVEAQPSASSTAVDFYYMEVDSELSGSLYQSYAVNNEWLYMTDRTESAEEGEPEYFAITRKRITDGFQETGYAVTDVTQIPWNVPLLMADREGNCYIYWKINFDYRNIGDSDWETSFLLEKYGADGKRQWSTELGIDELEGVGENLNLGAVTGDGRVILCSEGEGGRAFVFGTEGSLEEVYAPELEVLEGVAIGADNRIYGYCVAAGKEPVFAELSREGKSYSCPVVPFAVYSGYEEGICLRTGEGMLSYMPESGETERLWDWADEYVQIEGSNVDRVFQENGTYMLLCLEMPMSVLGTKQVLTFSVLTPGRGDYPARQTVIFATENLNSDTRVLIQMYNRQSRKYRIEVKKEDYAVYEKKLIQGLGADLMEISRIYTGDLARHGAFEELDAYFEGSISVAEGDILESVRRAGTIDGKYVGMIPGFFLHTLRARGDFVTPEEWTVWKFLEMGEQERMFSSQTPSRALDLCMGLTYGEHFVDYEQRTCSFDGEEFRRILEACGKWKEYDDGSNGDYNAQIGDWLFDAQFIHSVRDIVWQEPSAQSEYYQYTGANYLDTLVGYPGWEGGEYRLYALEMFAINSASENKEGAWDFLEYLLSDKVQAMMAQISHTLPVRKDFFEAHLRDGYADPRFSEHIQPTEADIARVREMAEAAVRNDRGSRSNPVWAIVTEESGMYFAGDATLDDTVQKIQTRVQLYLDEL